MRKSEWKWISGLVLCLASVCSAQRTEHVEFDASGVTVADQSLPSVAHRKATTPEGVTFSANKATFLRDGKPFPMTVGEIHPQRYPAEFWEEAIIEMKAGGLNTVACNWFWALFEPLKGQFDFSGRNDIRRFMELCKKHDMLVFNRIGPYCNADFLHGGLPPWVRGLPATERSNEPVYLERVKLYFNKLGEQVAGMMLEDGGPIFMIQVENDLGFSPVEWKTTFHHGGGAEHKGPRDPEGFWKHYLTLKQMAVDAGFKVPFYTLKGAGPDTIRNNVEEAADFILSYGAYMYLGNPRGINSPLSGLMPNASVNLIQESNPIAFIELGAAGSSHRVRYVAVPPAASAEATGMNVIGTHQTLICGWYIYQGGTNPFVPHWGPSAITTDFGVSYDFNAPLSEYGYERPAYYLLRRFHQTLLNYADRFCYGEILYQDPIVDSREDKTRASVRMGSRDGGVLFVSHYGNINALSPSDVSYAVNTSSGKVQIPSSGTLSLENGDFAMLPFNWDLGNGVKLISSTATPSGKIEQEGGLTMICSTVRDQVGEFVFQLPEHAKLITTGTQVKQGNQTIVTIEPGMEALITIETDKGNVICAVLPREQLHRSVETVFNGQKTYLISNHDLAVVKTEDGTRDAVRLTGKGENEFELYSYPSVTFAGMNQAESVGIFSKITASVPEANLEVDVEKFNDQKWYLKTPQESFDHLNDIYAKVEFDGLVCRIFNRNTGKLESDQLWARDLDWNVGLKRFKECLAGEGLLFFATPADGSNKTRLSTDGMTLEQISTNTNSSSLKGITFVPEYKLVLESAR